MILYETRFEKVCEQKNAYNGPFSFIWGYSWQYLTILCNIRWYLVIPDNTFTIFSNTKQCLPILNNLYQFLTIPDNTWQTWFLLVLPGIGKALRITGNMILVSWKYHHNTFLTGFLSVWYHHGMVLIMVIFTKPLMLSDDFTSPLNQRCTEIIYFIL